MRGRRWPRTTTRPSGCSARRSSSTAGAPRPSIAGAPCSPTGSGCGAERRRTDARVHLRTALDVFEGVGVPDWAERARAELQATGETARKRDPSTLDDLTPQELRIARLVSQGATNRDVAAQLFVSPKTVEYHLRKVFLKLGISSRVELLGGAFGDDVAQA